MNIAFYIAAIIAIFSTIMVITHTRIVHALLYMIASLLSIAVIFFILGAPFLAAIEVIVYAGAIMVLFVFVAIMLNLGSVESREREKNWLSHRPWILPGILCIILLAEFIYLLQTTDPLNVPISSIEPKQVGIALYTKYILGVELTAILLVSAVVGAYHIGKQKQKEHHRFLQEKNQSDKEIKLT